MNIDLIGYINIVICITDILVGLVVLISNSKKKVNIAYFLCTLTMGIWSLGLFLFDNPVFFNSVQWLKIVYIISYLMTFAQLFFVAAFNDSLRSKFKYVLIGLIIPLFFYGLYVLLIKNSVVLGTSYDSVSHSVIAIMGNDYLFYFIPILVSLVFMFAIQIILGQKRIGLKKKQSSYYWVAGFFMIVPLVVLDFVLPTFWNMTAYYKYSTLGNIIWTIIIAYSIYNTRFLDVRIVLGNILNFIFKSIYIFSLVILYLYIQNIYGSLWKDNFILITAAYSLLFALILNWLNQKTEKFIQKKYVYSKYNPIDELQRYSILNSKELSLEKIIDNTKVVLDDTLKPSSISIILFNNKDAHIIEESSFNSKIFNLGVVSNFVKTWENLNSNPILILSEIEEDHSTGKEMIDKRKNAIIEFMQNHSVEIVLPFEFESDISGLLMVGDKKDNSLYTSSDISFLESILKNSNVAIGRALLYSELQSFNQTLQSKVDAQTKELKVKVEQLQEARRKENDMIDIMGHELRTPATIVKLNAVLLDRFNNDITTDPEAYKRYVGRIKMAVENEIKLINTLLTSAKLEGDKIVIDPEEVNIQNEIDMSLHGNEKDAKDRYLELINKTDPKTPTIYADRARIIEILNNLISNGIKYTEKGSVTVETKYDEDWVTVSIIDTGKGIPQEDIPKLGHKFYRVSNYTETSEENKIDVVRPGGTGLGLYVTFNLIKKMGGDIKIESELGKGSKFIFTIPRYKGQDGNKPKNQSMDMFERLGLKK